MHIPAYWRGRCRLSEKRNLPAATNVPWFTRHVYTRSACKCLRVVCSGERVACLLSAGFPGTPSHCRGWCVARIPDTRLFVLRGGPLATGRKIAVHGLRDFLSISARGARDCTVKGQMAAGRYRRSSFAVCPRKRTKKATISRTREAAAGWSMRVACKRVPRAGIWGIYIVSV